MLTTAWVTSSIAMIRTETPKFLGQTTQILPVVNPAKFLSWLKIIPKLPFSDAQVSINAC